MFLNDPHDSQVPSILIIEIDGYVLREFVGFAHGPGGDEAPQDGNVLQRSSSVFSAANLRDIALVGYRQEKAR